MTTTPPFKRATRSDYTPALRPRTARQDGQRRLTPGYLVDLSDTKTTFDVGTSGSTSRITLLTPSTGMRLRIVRISVSQITTDGLHFLELFFGTATSLAGNNNKAIDIIRVPDLGQAGTRTWARGTGPLGEKNEVLSIRWITSPATQHKTIIEYTEER